LKLGFAKAAYQVGISGRVKVVETPATRNEAQRNPARASGLGMRGGEERLCSLMLNRLDAEKSGLRIFFLGVGIW
jgi:hypothetical protein